MIASLVNRNKYPVLKNPDGSTKERMAPWLYWILMALGLFVVVALSIPVDY